MIQEQTLHFIITGKDTKGHGQIPNGLNYQSTYDYKNIYEVMDSQKDIVSIVTKLKPIMVIKG